MMQTALSSLFSLFHQTLLYSPTSLALIYSHDFLFYFTILILYYTYCEDTTWQDDKRCNFIYKKLVSIEYAKKRYDMFQKSLSR